jgi:hypothetical protein
VGYPLRNLRYVDDALREAGYALAFTNQTGVNHVSRPPSPYDIRRISMSVEYDQAFFRAMMALPYLAPGRSASTIAGHSRAATRPAVVSGTRRRGDDERRRKPAARSGLVADR